MTNPSRKLRDTLSALLTKIFDFFISFEGERSAVPACGNQDAVGKFPHFARDRVSALAYTSIGEKLTMRTILSFIRQNSLSCKLRLHLRLIGPLGLLVATAIFASPGKALIANTPPPPMPGLRG